MPEQSSQSSEALEAASEAARLLPGDLTAQLVLGRLAESFERWDLAIDAWLKVLELRPECSEALDGWIKAFERQEELTDPASARQDWPAAVARWGAVIEAHGDRMPAGAYLRLARAHRALDDLDAAEAALRAGLERHPGHLKLVEQSAELASARQDWPAAAARWQAVLDLRDDAPSPDALVRLARLLRYAKRIPEARATLRPAFAVEPRNVRLLSEMALCDNDQAETKSAGSSVSSEASQAVEVVICVHNAFEDVRRCIDAVLEKTDFPYLLTVVDDASNPDIGAYLDDVAAGYSWMRVIRNEENLGYTRSANRGLKEARCDWVVLLNSDTIVTSSWLAGMLECARSAPRIKAVGPLSNVATFQSMPDMRGDDGSFAANMLPKGMTPDDAANVLREVSDRAYPRVPMLNGFCLLLNRLVLDDIGYLDETSFPTGYGEENDLCLRLIAAGHQLAIADHVYVYHAKSASFGHERREMLTKSGIEALKRKWVGYKYTYIAEEIHKLPSMENLRKRFKEKLMTIS